MKKLFVLIGLIFLSTTVIANNEKFFLEIKDESATIKLNVKDFHMVQLFRKVSGKSPVNIFEFTSVDSVFSEKVDAGSCYFIKIYKDSKDPHISNMKCVSETYFMGSIEVTLILFLTLLIFSFTAPYFISFRFLSAKMDSPEKKIAQTIKILAGEDSKSVMVHSSSDWIGDPVNVSVSSYLKNTLESDQENLVTTFYDGAIKKGKIPEISGVALINGQRPFLTNIQRKDVPRSAVFHITENNAESALDSFGDRKEKRKMIFSTSLPGMVTDLLYKRKALVSIEALVLDEESEKQSLISSRGAYLFLVVTASAVFVGSIFKTLGVEQLIDGILSLLAGAQ